MKDIFFLSGLPRSGSTLLGSILGQNPDFYVTPTSPLLDLLCYTNDAFNNLEKRFTFDVKQTSENVYKGLVQNFYANIEKPYIIDKHRGHPRNVNSLEKFVTKNPKIICTNRPISEVITSYIKLILDNNQSDNFIDNHLRSEKIPINIESRAKVLWEHYISDPYQSMQYGLKNNPKNILIINYDDIVFDLNNVLLKIYDFIGMKPYPGHYTSDIHNYCAEEKDHAWGLNNLHNIRTELNKISVSPKELLGEFLASHYDQFSLVQKNANSE